MATAGIAMILRVLETRSPFPINKLLGAIFNKARDAFVDPRMNAIITQAEIDLGTAPWFGGRQMTAADITMSYPMEALRDRGEVGDAHPNIMAWFKRVEASESYRAARKIDDRPSVAFKI